MPELNPVTVIGSAEMKEWLKKLSAVELVKPALEFDAKKWALEAHELGCLHGYGKLREPYGARDIKLREDYVTESAAIARRQLVIAGHRLGALLEDLYGRD